MLLDLGSGTGLSIKNYLHANQARQHDIQVHAFEPNPWKVAQLRKFLTDSKLHKQPMVHDTAVWIANDQVMFLLSHENTICPFSAAGTYFPETMPAQVPALSSNINAGLQLTC